MSTDINGVQLCIVAKADRDDVGIALLIDGGQSAQALALQVLNLGRSKFTHFSSSFSCCKCTTSDIQSLLASFGGEHQGEGSWLGTPQTPAGGFAPCTPAF